MWVTSLVVPWLKLPTSVAGDTASIPGWGNKISYAARCDQKKKKSETRNPQTNKNTDYMEQVDSMTLDFGIQMKGTVLLG